MTAVQIAVVQSLNRGLRSFVRLHLDKRESARTARHLIAHDVDGIYWPNRRKHLLEPVLVGGERKVTHEQLASNLLHSLSCGAHRASLPGPNAVRDEGKI